MAEVLDWRAGGDPEAMVLKCLETLRNGQLIALPTESGYLLAAHALQAEAVDRLAQFPLAVPSPLMLAVAGGEELRLWLPQLPRHAERLMRRLWPGPVQFVVPIPTRKPLHSSLSRHLLPDGHLTLAAPYHTAIASVIWNADFSLLVRETGIFQASALAALGADAISILVDGGDQTAVAATQVRIDPQSYTVLRPGAITIRDLERASARWIGFVCTGNTCRSPMAEALCKKLLATRLDCSIADLPRHGYNIFSAGVSAMSGDGPAPDAVTTMNEMGADLSEHRSQGLSESLVVGADHLIAMTRSHLIGLLNRFAPSATMQLLCGSEGDLEDPIGGGLEVYQECAKTIQRHLDRLVSEWSSHEIGSR